MSLQARPPATVAAPSFGGKARENSGRNQRDTRHCSGQAAAPAAQLAASAMGGESVEADVASCWISVPRLLRDLGSSCKLRGLESK